jgi:predicted metal-dependent hydrolase
MSSKTGRIHLWIRKFEGRDLDAHYLGFLDFFNREQFYEAHEILEELWLPARNSADDAFYKGLIQLAGAFVHLQKDRLRPAAALFKLAQTNLARYPLKYRHLDVATALENIASWLNELEEERFIRNPYEEGKRLLLSMN